MVLRIVVYFVLEYLVVAESSLSKVVDNAKKIKWACIEIYWGGGKSPCHQYNAIDISLSSDDCPNRGMLYF